MSDETTLRDTFAAAAMTGIIASSDDSEIKQPQAEFLSRQAWLVADAMLRERARNNTQNDAGSAADGDGSLHREGSRVRASANLTGNTCEPDAWLVLDGKLGAFSVHRDKAQAVCDSNAVNGMIFPLYRDPPQPKLTDAEREALRMSVREWDDSNDKAGWDVAATLRDLLDRLGGDK